MARKRKTKKSKHVRVQRGYRLKHGYKVVRRKRKSDEGFIAMAIAGMAIGALV